MLKPLFPIKKSWTDARVECKKIGGDLVSLETPEENYCLRYILYINGNNAPNLPISHGLFSYNNNNLSELHYSKISLLWVLQI
jgi:hypothetical protein